MVLPILLTNSSRQFHESEESIQSVPKPMAIVGSLNFGIMEIHLVFPLLMDTKVFNPLRLLVVRLWSHNHGTHSSIQEPVFKSPGI